MADSTALSLPAVIAPVNAILTPGIRAGLGSPLPFTGGAIVLEVVGRRSGRVRSVPLLCADCGNLLITSTVRGNAHWVRNLAAAGHAFVWLRGRRRPVDARVYRGGSLVTGGAPPASDRAIAAFSAATGTSVAVLALT